MLRHGNLLLRPIPEPEKVLTVAEVAAFTLATGEATHILTGRIKPSFLLHEEHHTVTVEPGWYEIVRQHV